MVTGRRTYLMINEIDDSVLLHQQPDPFGKSHIIALQVFILN